MTAKDLGMQQVFPRPPYSDERTSLPGHPGLTYRQWLIGMAVASGKESVEAVAIADRTLQSIADQ